MLLGVDWGEKRIGLAFSNGGTAAPLGVLEVGDRETVIKKIDKYCKELDVSKIIVGVPLSADGRDTVQSRDIKEFGKILEERSGTEVIFWNEALSSREALRKSIDAGKGKEQRSVLDDYSATLILQSYLNSQVDSV